MAVSGERHQPISVSERAHNGAGSGIPDAERGMIGRSVRSGRPFARRREQDAIPTKGQTTNPGAGV